MGTNDLKIVVIHDGLTKDVKDPLLVELGIEFGDDSVLHLENSNKGLAYIMENLRQRMIVLLDINFSHGELSGIQVFESIKKRTSLIYVIMITARNIGELDHDDLKTMINHDAFAIENVHSYPKIVGLVRNALHKMETRIDSALEQWINAHTDTEMDAPYILSRDGKSYTLREMLEEIRLQTQFGQEMEKKILLLAIDMLARGKKKIDD